MVSLADKILATNIHHPTFGMLPTEVRLSAALRPIRRPHRAALVRVPLLYHVQHPVLGVLPTELRLSAALRPLRRLLGVGASWLPLPPFDHERAADRTLHSAPLRPIRQLLGAALVGTPFGSHLHHSIISVLPTALNLSAAFRPIGRPHRAALAEALLTYHVQHPVSGVLPTKLRISAALQPIRWLPGAPLVGAPLTTSTITSSACSRETQPFCCPPTHATDAGIGPHGITSYTPLPPSHHYRAADRTSPFYCPRIDWGNRSGRTSYAPCPPSHRQHVADSIPPSCCLRSLAMPP